MLKSLTLLCALVGIFTALSLEAWLRGRLVKNESAVRTYAIVKNRNREFWSMQYLPLILMLAVLGAGLYFRAGRLHAAVFFGGAVLCFVSVLVGSRTVVTGSISSSSIAVTGEIRNSLKTAYRSGAVMGLSVSSIALIGIGSLYILIDDTDTLVELIASFGLGASVSALCLGLSGNAFSGAYALSVRKDDFTDYTGMFIGSGSDYVETYILSVCAAALLAEVGVDTSGVTSTFTVSSAAKYPLIIFAAGIAASVIGILSYRARIIKNPSSGVTAGNFIAAAIIVAVAVYFSISVLQSYIYAYCIAAGIAAVLAAGEIAKLYSSVGVVFKRNVPDARTVGASQTMIYSLSIGMMSIVIPTMLAGAAMIVSYYFASFYGIALASVGINSMAAVNCAVRGFSINAASSSEIASVVDPDAESPSAADVLLTASAKTDVIGKTYSAVSTTITLVAMFTALSVVGKRPDANLLSTVVFVGMTIGAISVFLSAGLIIRSIRMTSYVMRDYDEDEKQITTQRGLVPIYILTVLVPAAAGFTCGISGLISFACSSSITGMCVLFSFNNSGRYFDRMATETLGTVIKLMLAVTLVLAPLISDVTGIF